MKRVPATLLAFLPATAHAQSMSSSGALDGLLSALVLIIAGIVCINGLITTAVLWRADRYRIVAIFGGWTLSFVVNTGMSFLFLVLLLDNYNPMVPIGLWALTAIVTQTAYLIAARSFCREPEDSE